MNIDNFLKSKLQKNVFILYMIIQVFIFDIQLPLIFIEPAHLYQVISYTPSNL